MLRKLLASTALAALSLPLLHGCGTDGPVGYVRVVNATTEFATMDLYADGDEELSGVASQSVSAYAKIKNGSRVLELHNGGSPLASATTTQTLSTDHRYTLVGYVSGGALTTQFLNEDESAPSGNNAKLRVLNAASTDVGSLDVYLTTTACNQLGITDVAVATSVSGLQTAFTSFGTSSSAYNVCVTAAGQKSDLRLAGSVTFTAGEVANLVLTSTTGGVLVDGMLLVQQGQRTALPNTLARVRLVADAADGSAMSLSLNGTSIGSAPLSPALTDYVTVDLGTGGAITPALVIGTTTVTVPALTLATGVDYTVLVTGTAAAASLVALVDDNKPSTDTSNTVKIRLVNGLNGDTGTAALSVNGLLDINSVAFGEASSDVQVAAATGATLTGYANSLTQVWQTTDATLLAQKNYTVFLLGTTSTPTGFLVQDN